MSGRLVVIGLGPGSAEQVTPEASRSVAEATFFYGYKPYVDRLGLRDDQRAIASDNREELARAREALEKAAQGHSVAVVSGGDPGVFAMAAAICEAIEAGPVEWRDIELAIVPGVTITGVGNLILAALLMGIVNALVKPVAILLTLPITIVTLGIFLLVVNAGMFALVAWMLPAFTVSGFWAALFGWLIVSLVSWFASSLTDRRGAQGRQS